MAFHGSAGWLSSDSVVSADTLTVNVHLGRGGVPEDEYPTGDGQLTFIKRHDGNDRYLEIRVLRVDQEPLRIIVERDGIENLKLLLSE